MAVSQGATRCAPGARRRPG